MPAADKTLTEAAPEPTATVVPEPAVTAAEYEPPMPVPEREPATSLPPPNGAPPAARAATLLAVPAPSIGAPGRARMMAAMQQTIGNARVGAMLQAPPAPTTAPEGAAGAPAAPAPPGAVAAVTGVGAAQPAAPGEAAVAAAEAAPSGPGPATPPTSAAAAPGGLGAVPAPTEGSTVEAAAALPAPTGTTPETPAEPAAGGPEPAAPPPRSPEEDPGFHTTVKRIRAVARRQRAHQSAPVAAAAAQAAAPGPSNEVPAEAGKRQVGRMHKEQEQFQWFDRASFKRRLLDKINEVGPKNPVQAREFGSSPQLASLKSDLNTEVAERKKAAPAGLEQQANPPPDASGISPKPVEPLGPVGIGPAPADPGAAQATPKPLAESDVSGPMTEGDQQLDDQMAAARVTEAQLAVANEPIFTAALQAKQEAKAHATQASQSFRQEETATLAEAQQVAAGSALEQAQAMHAGRKQSLTGVRSSQTDTMTADQRARAAFEAEFEGIYTDTSVAVRACLKQLDDDVDAAFNGGVEAARKAFEDYVEAALDERYSGAMGKATWLADKVLPGLPFGIELIFRRGRQLYIERMDALLDEVAGIIESKLTAAMLEIVKGEKRVVDVVASQKPSLQTVAQKAAQAIQGRFDDLEQEVISKRDQLIDSLAQRYRENVTQLDARIEELQAEHRGLLSKAFDAVVGVIKTILELKNMLLNVLARVGDVVGQIIADPIGFLGNLVSGIRLGLDNFISNIASHLQQAFMSWLFGALQGAGIQLPDQLDLKGILSIAMQVLGLTYQAIRARAVKLLGEGLVSTLERVAEPFIVLIREGPGGLWEWIKDQLSDLKDKVLGEIESFLITRVIKAGITWVLSLLNPASAFIRACKLIYDIVMFFVERGRQIVELVNAVIDAVAAIARGSLEGAAKLVENALAKALPVVVGFLASLLNLGGISDKIREIIEKLRAPVTKAVDWVIGKAVALVKAGGKLLGLGREKVPESKQPAAGLDPTDHESVATHAVQDMEKVSGAAGDLADLRAKKEAQAQQVEQHYTQILEPGIRLTITFEPAVTDVKDADVDFVVVIAPNTKMKKGSVALPSVDIDFKEGDEAYIQPFGPKEEHGRFLRERVIHGVVFLEFSISSRYKLGGTISFPKTATSRYRKSPKSGPHTMSLAITVGGQQVFTDTLVSGNMTQEEYELGYPLNMLATHTEARALEKYRDYLRPAAHWQMTGHYLSCPSCKGKMNSAARSGATFAYEPGGFRAP